MSQDTGKPSAAMEASVREAIQTFESMLEVFPEDLNALESLVAAYHQTGDREKLARHGRSLLQLLATGGDWQRIGEIAASILEIFPDDPFFRGMLEKARDQLGVEAFGPVDNKDAAAKEAEAQTTDAAAKKDKSGKKDRDSFVTRAIPAQELGFDLRGELDLAYHLLTREIINQNHYETAIDRLTESSLNSRNESPLCFLQELREMERLDIDRIIDFLAADSGVPFIELSRCECQEAAYRLMPVMLAKRLGILPFDHLGEDLMVAILNPASKDLRDRIVRHFGGKVHFFFTAPDEFAAAITKIQDIIAKAGGGAL